MRIRCDSAIATLDRRLVATPRERKRAAMDDAMSALLRVRRDVLEHTFRLMRGRAELGYGPEILACIFAVLDQSPVEQDPELRALLDEALDPWRMTRPG